MGRKLKSRIVVLTGGIGSGKSKAESLFKSLGIFTIDADEVSNNLLQKGAVGYKKIVHRFGKKMLNESGDLDRLKIRELIFTNSNIKIEIENILHPEIQKNMEKELVKSTSPYCIKTIPLWYELYGLKRPAQIWKIIVIETPFEVRRKRATRRSLKDLKTFDLIICNQADDAQRRQIADNLIINDSNIESLDSQVKKIHDEYTIYLGNE